MTLKDYRSKWGEHGIMLPPSPTTKTYLNNLQRCDLVAWYLDCYPNRAKAYREGALTFDDALEEAGNVVRDGQGPVLNEHV